jgi:predicted neutral ceramidase superfamily lipid hydrolase
VADTATMKPSYTLTFVVLLVVNTITVAAAYALLINDDNIRLLVAATLLAVVVVAQTVRCRPFLPILSWVSTIPVAIAMAYLIDAHPALDWSGPGEPDQISLTPIVPVITVLYAIGFTLIAGTAYLAYLALRKRYPRGNR